MSDTSNASKDFKVIAVLSGLVILCRMKARLLWQSLLASKSRWSMLILAAALLFVAFDIARSSPYVIDMIERVFLGELVRWIMTFGLIYLVLIVFASDLIMGHTLNAGQLSSDHAFLISLPIPTLSLLGMRIFERVATDWPGLLFLWSTFVGIACRNGFDLVSFFAATLLFIQLQSLIILTIILLSGLLHRLARPAAVNNFFSLFGYFTAFSAIIPYVAISYNSQNVLSWLLFHFGQWQKTAHVLLKPARWLVDAIVDGLGTRSFLAWELFWLSGLIFGASLFLAMARAHWLTWVHPGSLARQTSSRKWLPALLRKDFQLLRSDFNLLSNSLFMPVTIIVMQVFIFRENLLAAFKLSHAMNILAAAALYFCLFGPLNAVGSEGLAITLLETLPLSPNRFLGYKILFWSLLAESFFIPSALGVCWYFGFAKSECLFLTAWLTVLIPAMVWVAVCMSAIFPRFDGKVLQQRSTFEGKILAPLAMSLAIPIKDFSPASIEGLIIFISIALSIHAKAIKNIAKRLDTEYNLAPVFRVSDAFLAFLAVMGLQNIVWNLTLMTFGRSVPSLLPCSLTYLLAMILLARVSWYYAKARFPGASAALGLIRCHFGKIALGALAGAILVISAVWYFEHIDAAIYALERSLYVWFGWPVNSLFSESLDRIFAASAERWSAVVELLGKNWSLFVVSIIVCLIAPIIEEVFFRGFTYRALYEDFGWKGWGGIIANSCIFALYHPVILMPLTFILGMLATLLFRWTGSLWPSIVLHAIYNAGILAIHAMRF